MTVTVVFSCNLGLDLAAIPLAIAITIAVLYSIFVGFLWWYMER